MNFPYTCLQCHKIEEESSEAWDIQIENSEVTAVICPDCKDTQASYAAHETEELILGEMAYEHERNEGLKSAHAWPSDTSTTNDGQPWRTATELGIELGSGTEPNNTKPVSEDEK